MQDSGYEKKTIIQMASDKMIPKHDYDKPFTIRFLERSESKEECQPARRGGG
jgi:hypothetical protein